MSVQKKKSFDPYKRAGITAFMTIGPMQGQKYLASLDDGRFVNSAAICEVLPEHEHMVDGPGMVMYCHLNTGEIIPAPKFLVEGLQEMFLPEPEEGAVAGVATDWKWRSRGKEWPGMPWEDEKN